MPDLPEQREIDVIFKNDGITELLTQQTDYIEVIETRDAGAHHDGANSAGVGVIVPRQAVRELGDRHSSSAQIDAKHVAAFRAQLVQHGGLSDMPLLRPTGRTSPCCSSPSMNSDMVCFDKEVTLARSARCAGRRKSARKTPR